MQLFAHVYKVFVNLVPKFGELFEIESSTLYISVLINLCRDIRPSAVMLHGNYNARIFEHEALHLSVV